MGLTVRSSLKGKLRQGCTDQKWGKEDLRSLSLSMTKGRRFGLLRAEQHCAQVQKGDAAAKTASSVDLEC